MKIPDKYKPWIEARKRHRLSHAHVQMARELGLNPQKLGKLDNHRQEPWKLPLPQFIEQCYEDRFGKDRPDEVRSMEELVKHHQQKKADRKQRRHNEPKSTDENNDGRELHVGPGSFYVAGQNQSPAGILATEMH